LGSLSDDAVVTMIGSIDRLDPADGEQLRNQLCLRPDRQTSFWLFEFNAARVAADDVLDEYCAGRQSSHSADR
jgi:hypothetical protein